ncbi:MAG: redoxin domain-containing protein [Opitutaceae bacterium]
MKLSHILATASFAIASITSAGVATGSAAPDFTLTDTKGVSHSLSDFKGKYVVLEWTRHDCPFVVKFYENGDMQALQKEMTDKAVVWLQIASSAKGKSGYLTAEQAEAIRIGTGTASTALLLDASGKVGRQYDARTTPHMYLINPAGELVYQGAIDSIKSARSKDIAKATNYVKAAYESAIAGEPIENATTTPYGCGVKY